tara:strand:+ start:1611 stop:1850 length:240 start_codon:yes stop_codon:yes gene_type:complete
LTLAPEFGKLVLTMNWELYIMDTISKIRSLQTELNNEDLDVPKMRREVNQSNMRWLLRNVSIKNPLRAKRIIKLIKEII